MMNVLITGAAGCLGRAVTRYLVQQQNLNLYATDIRPSPFEENSGLKYQAFDIRHAEFLEWVEQIRPDCIVHLASVLQLSKHMNREQAFAIDVTATEALLAKAAAIGVRKFIVTTSGAAYGYHPENVKEEILETWPLRGNKDYFYSDHKRQVEALLERYLQDHPQMKQVVFRPGAIVGPGFDGPVVNLLQQKVITGLVGCDSPFNFIWSEDVAGYVYEAIHSDLTGTFNLSGKGTLSLPAIARKLNRLYVPLPAMLIKAALTVLRPLGLSQYGPEQVKFIQYRPVLNSEKLRQHFDYKAQYTSEEALDAFIAIAS